MLLNTPRQKMRGYPLRNINSSVQICVEDKGVGFYPPADKSSNTTIEGLGLFRIKERLGSLGGQFEIKSQPNHGTQVTLVAPLSSGVENP